MSARIAFRWYESGEAHDSHEYYNDDETWTYGFHVFSPGHLVVSRIQNTDQNSTQFPKIETVKVYGPLGYLSVSGDDFGETPFSWKYRDSTGVWGPAQYPEN